MLTMFKKYMIFMIVLLSCIEFSVLLDSTKDPNGSKLKILSRRKRYVAFPEGSSFSCAGCMTVGLIGQPAPSTSPGTFTWGMNWGVAYELPNNTETAAFYHIKKKKIYTNMLQRKYRRDLYSKLEAILDTMGFSGRECILRTLCESSQRLVPRGGNMIEEIFRTMFTLPQTKVLATEPLEHSIYDAAHRLGRLMDSCDRFKCPISLIDWMKGYYDAPSPNVDIARNPWALFSSNFG